MIIMNFFDDLLKLFILAHIRALLWLYWVFSYYMCIKSEVFAGSYLSPSFFSDDLLWALTYFCDIRVPLYVTLPSLASFSLIFLCEEWQ